MNPQPTKEEMEKPNKPDSWLYWTRTHFRAHAYEIIIALIGGTLGNIDRIIDSVTPLFAPPHPSHYVFTSDISGTPSHPYLLRKEAFFNFKNIASGVDRLSGETHGEVLDGTDHKVPKTWINSGYRIADRLVYSYYSASPLGQGAGVYYFVANGNDWVGYWLGRDAITGQTIRSPSVLTARDISQSDAQREFPALAEKSTVLSQLPQ